MASYQYKQTFFVFTLSLMTVLGVAYYIYGQPKSNISGGSSVSAVANTIQTAPIETNEDWRRQFIEKGTANDGYKTDKTAVTETAKKKDTTSTEILGQNFLTQYMSLKETGLSSDQEIVASAMDKVINESTNNLANIKLYSINDIRVFDDTATMREEYRKVLSAVEKAYDGRVDEAVIALAALETQDMSRLGQIDATIAVYKKMIDQLVYAPVPKTLAPYHVDLINNIVVLRASAEAFRKFDTDPLKGTAFLRDNALATLNTDDLFLGIQTYLKTVSVAKNQ